MSSTSSSVECDGLSFIVKIFNVHETQIDRSRDQITRLPNAIDRSILSYLDRHFFFVLFFTDIIFYICKFILFTSISNPICGAKYTYRIVIASNVSGNYFNIVRRQL